MKENKGLVMNVGTSSVILILLVFALSVFALLSIRASNSELQLTEKTGESIQEYYQADKDAQYALCYIKKIVADFKVEELEGKLGSLKDVKDKGLANLLDITLHLQKDVIFTGKQKDRLGTIEYVIYMEEGKRLEVSLALQGDRSLLVEKWCMVKEPWTEEEFGQDAELWDGMVITE